MTRWIRLVFFLAGASVLAALLASINWSELGQALAAVSLRPLLLAIALAAVNVAVKGVRWQLMVSRLSGQHLSLPAASAAILAGVAGASLSPSRAVDLAKPLMLKERFGTGLASSTAAVLVERLLDGAAFIVLFGGSLALLPGARGAEIQPVLLAVGLLLVGAASLLGVPERLGRVVGAATARAPLSAHIKQRLGSVVDAFFASISLWRQRRQLWPLLALSVAAAVLEGLRVAAVFAAMGTPVAIVVAVFAFSAANLVAVASFIPGGIGITELSMAGIVGLVFRAHGARTLIIGAVLVDRLLSYYLVVLAGSLVLMTSGRGRKTPGGR